MIYVGGALGGFDGPAGGLYPKLAHELSRPGGMTGLRLHYRQPGEFEECVLDVLGGVSFLRGVGAQRVVLVGHSFGAAVVIKAGELSDAVAGVAALSPQLYGTRMVERLAPRPLLLVHGTADQILNAEASNLASVQQNGQQARWDEHKKSNPSMHGLASLVVAVTPTALPSDLPPNTVRHSILLHFHLLCIAISGKSPEQNGRRTATGK